MVNVNKTGTPDFYLHHGFIDKIWDDWQKKSDLHKRSYFGNITTPMATTIFSPRDVHDNENQPGTQYNYLHGKNNVNCQKKNSWGGLFKR